MRELSKTLTKVVNTIEKSNATKEESKKKVDKVVAPSKKRAMAAQPAEQRIQNQAQKAKKVDTSSKLSEKRSQKKEATVRKHTPSVDQQLLEYEAVEYLLQQAHELMELASTPIQERAHRLATRLMAQLVEDRVRDTSTVDGKTVDHQRRHPPSNQS